MVNMVDSVATVSNSCCTVCPDLASTKAPFGEKVGCARMSLMSQAFTTSGGVSAIIQGRGSKEERRGGDGGQWGGAGSSVQAQFLWQSGLQEGGAEVMTDGDDVQHGAELAGAENT